MRLFRLLLDPFGYGGGGYGAAPQPPAMMQVNPASVAAIQNPIVSGQMPAMPTGYVPTTNAPQVFHQNGYPVQPFQQQPQQSQPYQFAPPAYYPTTQTTFGPNPTAPGGYLNPVPVTGGPVHMIPNNQGTGFPLQFAPPLPTTYLPPQQPIPQQAAPPQPYQLPQIQTYVPGQQPAAPPPVIATLPAAAPPALPSDLLNHNPRTLVEAQQLLQGLRQERVGALTKAGQVAEAMRVQQTNYQNQLATVQQQLGQAHEALTTATRDRVLSDSLAGIVFRDQASALNCRQLIANRIEIGQDGQVRERGTGLPGPQAIQNYLRGDLAVFLAPSSVGGGPAPAGQYPAPGGNGQPMSVGELSLQRYQQALQSQVGMGQFQPAYAVPGQPQVHPAFQSR